MRYGMAGAIMRLLVSLLMTAAQTLAAAPVIRCAPVIRRYEDGLRWTHGSLVPGQAVWIAMTPVLYRAAVPRQFPTPSVSRGHHGMAACALRAAPVGVRVRGMP